MPRSISVFVFENCFRKHKQKTLFFFVKKMFGKLSSKTVFENRKQSLRRLNNYFQNSFHLKRKYKIVWHFYIFFVFSIYWVISK
jgi:hypothetical protein